MLGLSLLLLLLFYFILLCVVYIEYNEEYTI